jgi:CRP-like cAMP-binding protein
MTGVRGADLANVSLFADLPEDELAALAEQSRARPLGDGDVLFEQGQPARNLYVVVSGGLVLRAGDGGSSVIVDTLRPGDLVGWSAMRPGAITLSTARAVGPSKVIAIPVDPIIDLAAGGSRESRRLVQRIVALAATHLEASWAQLLQVGREGVITAG